MTILRRRWHAIVCGIAAFGLAAAAGCGPMPVLTPEGPGAARIVDLWWWLFWLTFVPAVIVIGFCLAAVWRGRRASTATRDTDSADNTIIIVGGAVIPALILFTLLVHSFRTGQATTEPPSPPAVTVDIIGHMFWWEIRYPDLGVTTANEIHVPVGVPTRIQVVSADVIHSFWVPALHGKIDANPSRVNVFWLQPDRPGIYWGQCAEFCGVQHALMSLRLIAEPPEAFDDWIERTRQPALPPVDALAQRGQEVFEQAGCALCHAVRGVFELDAVGTVGPDLTHLASRRTLASAVMPNTRENLRQWILDPHVRKPGVRMPATPLAPEDLEALIAYLESLR